MLFIEVAQEWWIGNKIMLREISCNKKEMTIEKHILPWFGKMEIENVSDVDVNEFTIYELEHGNRLTGEGLCKNSVIKEVAIVKCILEYAFLKNYITFNPAVLVQTMKREPVKEFSIYSFDEVQKLIKAARPKWLGDLILLAYNTGLRKCECYGLQWNDMNFANKKLTIFRSVTASKPHECLISEPKTKKSKRLLLLDDETIDMLARRCRNRTSDTWVFADQNGQLISPWYNVKYFRKACESADIPIRRFYDLRHTHITELVIEGISLPIIQEIAGHSSIDMTMHYTHLTVDSQQRAVDVVNKKYSRGKKS